MSRRPPMRDARRPPLQGPHLTAHDWPDRRRREVNLDERRERFTPTGPRRILFAPEPSQAVGVASPATFRRAAAIACRPCGDRRRGSVAQHTTPAVGAAATKASTSPIRAPLCNPSYDIEWHRLCFSSLHTRKFLLSTKANPGRPGDAKPTGLSESAGHHRKRTHTHATREVEFRAIDAGIRSVLHHRLRPWRRV